MPKRELLMATATKSTSMVTVTVSLTDAEAGYLRGFLGKNTREVLREHNVIEVYDALADALSPF